MYIPSGGSSYWEAITGGIRALDGAQRLLDITHSSGVTTVTGADATSDDLKLLCNGTDSYPYIVLEGNGGSKYFCAEEQYHYFYEGATLFALFRAVSNNYEIGIKETGTSPTNLSGFGQLYTKSDNKLYFRDGDGTEHEIAYV